MQQAYDCIDARFVSKHAFQTQLACLMSLRTFENHPLGFLVAWSEQDTANNDMISVIMDDALHTSWQGKAFSDNKGRAAQLFLHDGGTLLDCRNGLVQATTIQFAAKAGCPYRVDGHGTKHQSAVNLSYNWQAVAMVRSVDSDNITIFSPSLTRTGRAVIVSASQSAGMFGWLRMSVGCSPIVEMFGWLRMSVDSSPIVEVRPRVEPDRPARREKENAFCEEVWVMGSNQKMTMHTVIWLQVLNAIAMAVIFWKLQGKF